MPQRLIVVLAGLLISCQCVAKVPADPAVDKAVQYFVARDANADPIALLFLDRLRRKYELAPLAAVVSHLKNAKDDPAHPDHQLMLHLRIYARLVNPAAKPSAEDLAAANLDVDRLAMEAMYCDGKPGQPDLDGRLRAIAKHGGYYLSHVPMYGRWALENGCLEPAVAKQLFADMSEKLVAMIVAENEATDLAMESMAILYDTGHGAKVRPEWIRKVRAAQQKDGGWGHMPVGAPSNDHSSVCGLWVLLQATRPNTPDKPWLR